MTDTELAAIRLRQESRKKRSKWSTVSKLIMEDVNVLLAEVDRLRAAVQQEREAYVVLVEQVRNHGREGGVGYYAHDAYQAACDLFAAAIRQRGTS